MGVDGIGKGGTPPVRPLESDPASPADGVGAPSSTGAASEVDPIEAAAGSDALAALGRGDITVEAYFDARVAEAVQHLEGRLPADELDFVRSSLREQLETDPVVAELVRRAASAAGVDGSG